MKQNTEKQGIKEVKLGKHRNAFGSTSLKLEVNIPTCLLPLQSHSLFFHCVPLVAIASTPKKGKQVVL